MIYLKNPTDLLKISAWLCQPFQDEMQIIATAGRGKYNLVWVGEWERCGGYACTRVYDWHDIHMDSKNIQHYCN